VKEWHTGLTIFVTLVAFVPGNARTGPLKAVLRAIALMPQNVPNAVHALIFVRWVRQ
jgi:hypothetical protein